MNADVIGAFFAGVFGVLGLQTVMAVLGGLWWHARRPRPAHAARLAAVSADTLMRTMNQGNPPETVRRIPEH